MPVGYVCTPDWCQSFTNQVLYHRNQQVNIENNVFVFSNALTSSKMAIHQLHTLFCINTYPLASFPDPMHTKKNQIIFSYGAWEQG